MASIVYLLFLLAAAATSLAYGAQVAPVWPLPKQPPETHLGLYEQSQKTADLTRLISETLTLNNKTLLKPSSGESVSSIDNKQPFKDDWTFERVEYDLIEFLQDLGARYQLSKDDDQSAAPSADIEARRVTSGSSGSNFNTTRPVNEIPKEESTKSNTDKVPELATYTASIAASTTEISTSLAGDDHDIAESKWQYGIFDRFTRARASSTTTSTTRDPYVDQLDKLDVRQFNSDECGLRTYLERAYSKGTDELDNQEISKDLNQRRQRPSLSLLGQKKYQIQIVASDLIDKGVAGVADKEASPASTINNWADKSEKDAYDSYKEQQQRGDLPSLLDRVPNLAHESGDSEFNLASRRHFLQQQLGNTLQLLGFNGSAQSVAEFLNQTSGISLNFRENMMKKSAHSNKLAKSLISSVVPKQQQQQQQQGSNKGADRLAEVGGDQATASSLSGRQDELKLEARVIGGSDARL